MPPATSGTDTIATLREINARIGIPDRLSMLGVHADQVPAIVQSSRGNSMDGNPRKLSDEELTQLLTSVL